MEYLSRQINKKYYCNMALKVNDHCAPKKLADFLVRRNTDGLNISDAFYLNFDEDDNNNVKSHKPFFIS